MTNHFAIRNSTLGFCMTDYFDIRNSTFGLRPVLANPPFNDSDWFRKDDDVRWQWREATWTTNGSPKGEHNQAHQYPSPQRGSANFAWVQHFIHHLAPHGMAGFVLVRFWFWLKLRAAGVFRGLDNSKPVSFRKRRRETLIVDAGTMRTLVNRVPVR